MSITYTTKAKLANPATNDPSWDASWRANFNLLDALGPVGGLAVTLHETPSTTLTVDVAAGVYIKQDGTAGTYAGVSAQAIPTGTTRVLYLDGTAAFALTLGTSYPATPHVRLGTAI